MYSQIIKEGFLNLETVPEAKSLTNRGTLHKRLTLMILHILGLRLYFASEGPDRRTFSSLRPSALTGGFVETGLLASRLGKNWWHWTVFLDPCPDFCNSKNELKSGFFRHRT